MSLWLPCGLHGSAVPNTVTVTVTVTGVPISGTLVPWKPPCAQLREDSLASLVDLWGECTKQTRLIESILAADDCGWLG
jgi:hypothetical protein